MQSKLLPIKCKACIHGHESCSLCNNKGIITNQKHLKLIKKLEAIKKEVIKKALVG